MKGLFMLTIVTPVKCGDPSILTAFIEGNMKVLKEHPFVVIDSGGGQSLQSIATTYLKRNVPFWTARKLGYEYVQTECILNLDSDVIVPKGYIEQALEVLKNADAVSIFYEDAGHCQGALEFGVSIWKTNVLRELYDFSIDKVMDGKIVKVGSMAFSTLNHGWCECVYLWRKLKENGYKLETLPYRAKHLR